MHITREGNLVTLINVFETKPEQQQGLIEQWVRFTEAVRNEPGYVGTALHKSTDGTRVINYAHWRSQADFDFLPEEAWSGLHTVRPERLAHRSPHLRRGLSR